MTSNPKISGIVQAGVVDCKMLHAIDGRWIGDKQRRAQPAFFDALIHSRVRLEDEELLHLADLFFERHLFQKVISPLHGGWREDRLGR